MRNVIPFNIRLRARPKFGARARDFSHIPITCQLIRNLRVECLLSPRPLTPTISIINMSQLCHSYNVITDVGFYICNLSLLLHTRRNETQESKDFQGYMYILYRYLQSTSKNGLKFFCVLYAYFKSMKMDWIRADISLISEKKYSCLRVTNFIPKTFIIINPKLTTSN